MGLSKFPQALLGGNRSSREGRAGRLFPGRVLLLILLVVVCIGQAAWAEEPEGEKKSPVMLLPRIGIGIAA